MYLDSNILVLGAAQTFFECSMYVFVLLYTPAIESAALTHFGKEEDDNDWQWYVTDSCLF